MKKKPAPSTEEALNNCIEDMTMVDDDSVQKNAVTEANEEVEEAYHEAKADEADEKLEVVASTLKRQDLLILCCNTASNPKHVRISLLTLECFVWTTILGPGNNLNISKCLSRFSF